MGHNREEIKLSSGRLPEQAPVDAYRGRSVNGMLLLAVFGRPALDPRFSEALYDLCNPERIQAGVSDLWEKFLQKYPHASQRVVFVGRSQNESLRSDPDFRELKKKIKRKYLSELFPGWDLADVLDCVVLDTRNQAGKTEGLDRQFKGSLITDPIRYWFIRCYGEQFERLQRPPSGKELEKHYPDVVGRFPNARKPFKSETASFAPGQENLRKLIQQLDLWMIDQKFIDAVVSSCRKLSRKGVAISGHSIWEQLTPARQSKESLKKWNIRDFWERLELLTGLFSPQNPIEIPLLSAWLFWRRLKETPQNTPHVHLLLLIEGLQDSLPRDVLRSLSLAHNQLAEHGSEEPLFVSDLCRDNSLFSELVAEIQHALVLRIANG